MQDPQAFVPCAVFISLQESEVLGNLMSWPPLTFQENETRELHMSDPNVPHGRWI